MKYAFGLTFIFLWMFGAAYISADMAVASFNSKHNVLIMPVSDIKAVARDVDAERAQHDFERKHPNVSE